jgi:hypothetical protein
MTYFLRRFNFKENYLCFLIIFSLKISNLGMTKETPINKISWSRIFKIIKKKIKKWRILEILPWIIPPDMGILIGHTTSNPFIIPLSYPCWMPFYFYYYSIFSRIPSYWFLVGMSRLSLMIALFMKDCWWTVDVIRFQRYWW